MLIGKQAFDSRMTVCSETKTLVYVNGARRTKRLNGRSTD